MISEPGTEGQKSMLHTVLRSQAPVFWPQVYARKQWKPLNTKGQGFIEVRSRTLGSCRRHLLDHMVTVDYTSIYLCRSSKMCIFAKVRWFTRFPALRKMEELMAFKGGLLRSEVSPKAPAPVAVSQEAAQVGDPSK